MKRFEPLELAATLDELALPYTAERQIMGSYVMPGSHETAVHSSNLADRQGIKNIFCRGLQEKLAVKAVSGTLSPKECARLIFEPHPNSEDIPTEAAAIVYGAMRHCIMNQPATRSTFAQARRWNLLDDVVISNRFENPGGVIFSRSGVEHHYMYPSQPGVPGNWLALQEAIVDTAAIRLTEKPLHIPLPNLRLG